MKRFVAARVKKARLDAGLSQADLAALIGMTSDNYNKLETGKRGISAKMIKKLSSIPSLGLDEDDLKGLKALETFGTKVIKKAYYSLVTEGLIPLEEVAEIKKRAK